MIDSVNECYSGGTSPDISASWIKNLFDQEPTDENEAQALFDRLYLRHSVQQSTQSPTLFEPHPNLHLDESERTFSLLENPIPLEVGEEPLALQSNQADQSCHHTHIDTTLRSQDQPQPPLVSHTNLNHADHEPFWTTKIAPEVSNQSAKSSRVSCVRVLRRFLQSFSMPTLV